MNFSRFRSPLSFLSGLVLAIFCANAVVARAEFFSIGDPARAWKKNTLRVCWLNDPSVMASSTFLGVVSRPKLDHTSDIRRNTIRNLLGANYPETLTGIKLTDFVDCPARGKGLEKFDVLIADGFEFKDGSINFGFSSIGDDHVATVSVGAFDFSMIAFNLTSTRTITGVKNDWFLEKLRKLGKKSATKRGVFEDAYGAMSETLVQDHLKITLIHEFGHLFGLVHEDTRKDAPEPKDVPFCWSFSSAYHKESSSTAPINGKTPALDRFGTPFDLFSIMNYCRHDMVDWYERARFVCAWADSMKLVSRLPEADRPAMRRVLEQCPFIVSTGFPIGPTRGDRYGIRAMYALPQTDKPEDTDYRKSPMKMKWVSIFKDFASQSWLDGDPVGDYMDALAKKKKPPTSKDAGGSSSSKN